MPDFLPHWLLVLSAWIGFLNLCACAVTIAWALLLDALGACPNSGGWHA